MGEAPTKEGVRVGQIRKTLHLMVLSRLFPSLPTKKRAEPNMVISVVLMVPLGLFPSSLIFLFQRGLKITSLSYCCKIILLIGPEITGFYFYPVLFNLSEVNGDRLCFSSRKLSPETHSRHTDRQTLLSMSNHVIS